MGPCCQLTYKKYLNADGSIDPDALQVAIDESNQWIAEHTPSVTPSYSTAEEAIFSGTLRKCHCHTKGSMVLH